MLFRRIQHPSQADLSAYVDGELAVSWARSVAAHAEACAECRGTLDGLRETKALLGGLPRAMLPHSFALSAAQAGLQAARPIASRPSALRFAPAVSLAALAVLLLVDVSLPSGEGNSSSKPDDFRAGITAKSSAESADSVSGPTLQAAPAAAAIAPSPLARAANSDAGVVGATGPAAAAPAAVAPSAAGQAAPAGQASTPAEAQAVPPAAAVPSGQDSRGLSLPPAPPVAIQPFFATPGSDAGGAGAAAAPAPTTGGDAPGPAQPQQPAVIASEDDSEDNDRTLLRLLEVLVAAIFFASLLAVLWPRLTREERQ